MLNNEKIFKWNTMGEMVDFFSHSNIDNATIVDNCIKAYSKINSDLYNKIIFLLI